MLVITGIFEDGRFIPDSPITIPEKKKVKVIVEDHAAETSSTEEAAVKKIPKITMSQIEEWSKAPEIQSLVGVLKNANLPPDITIKDIRNERLMEKYGA